VTSPGSFSARCRKASGSARKLRAPPRLRKAATKGAAPAARSERRWHRGLAGGAAF
jgi:hypothetical protein